METRRDRNLEPLLAVALPLLVSAVLLFLLSRNDLDGRLVDPYFDFEKQRWPLKRNFWVEEILHTRARDLVFLVAVGGLAVAVLGRFWERLRPYRRAALYMTLCIAIAAGLAGLLKSFSPVPCPWDSVRFGDDIPHGSPFAAPPPGVRYGHCFPGAHAAGGFCFMAFYFVLRERSRRWAWIALVLGWLVGHVYGWDQMMRGAHYPSHNVWASILAWVVACALYWGPFRGRLMRPPSSWS